MSAAVLSTAALSAALFPAANAIIIRDDVDDAMYTTDSDAFPAVFPMDPSGAKQKGECCATLITAQHAVTAAHCFEGGEWEAFDVEISGATFTVEAVHNNPCFDYDNDGPDGHDIAVIRLDRALTDAMDVAPYPIYTAGDEVGKRIQIMGWGDTGEAGDTFAEYDDDDEGCNDGSNPDCVTTDRTFRLGENIVIDTDDGVLHYRFDNPSSAGSTALDLEAMAWSGDSGGPALITDDDGTVFIAGTNSAGDCCDYGSVDGYKRTGDHFEWIKSVIESDLGELTESGLTGSTSATPAFASGDACVWSSDDDDALPIAAIVGGALAVILVGVAGFAMAKRKRGGQQFSSEMTGGV